MVRATLPLFTLCAGLTGVLYLELATPISVPEMAQARFAPPRFTPQTVASDLPARRQAFLTTILARPLLSPTRRPTGSPVLVQRTSPPRLAGIVVSNAAAVAIFSEMPDKTILAQVGDRVGPYVVKGIADGEVTVNGPSGKQVLHPTFASSGAADRTSVTALPVMSNAAGKQPPLPSPEFMRQWVRKQIKDGS